MKASLLAHFVPFSAVPVTAWLVPWKAETVWASVGVVAAAWFAVKATAEYLGQVRRPPV